MWFLLILCLGLPLGIAINLICLHRLFGNIYIVVVMVVILNNSSFQLVRCMLSFRDAGKSQHSYVWLLLNSRSNENNKRKHHTLSVFPSVQCCRWKG